MLPSKPLWCTMKKSYGTYQMKENNTSKRVSLWHLTYWTILSTSVAATPNISKGLKNTHYLLVVDNFSWFPIVKRLQSLNSMSVIKQLKEIFMEIGLPWCIVSDGGTQFTSQEFKDFMRVWDIQHRVTSCTNVQSNGQAEWFVQTIKNSLTKSMEGGEDPHLAVLSYITTPFNHSLPLPAELLNSRKFRCLVPLWIRKQNHIQQYRKMMQHQKHEQAKCYNKSAKDLPSLKTGDGVYVQLVPDVRDGSQQLL